MTSPVVLVVGALTGIGRAGALVFAEKGARLVIAGRDSDDGEAFAEALCARGTQAEFLRADVRHEIEVSELLRKTLERFGRLDAAVNAAGTEGSAGPLIERTPEDLAATFDTNVLGTFLCLKHELRAMLPQGAGSIVNISSTLAQRTAPGTSLYAASKLAVEGLTKVAALEAASSHVRVNAVAPGAIDAAMLNEVARVIAFLCSDQAPFMTGQIVGVEGGKIA